MEDIKQIGLNIWGLKGGKSCFCHSENLDVKAPEIERTWLDNREFVYVSDLTVRFYALEFTPNYKVFTLYRPVNDTGRTGAYYAVTIYVPHALKVNRILDLLRQISDAYYKDHYDAFGNPNTNPDYVQVYLELIKNYAGNIVKENEVRAWEGSAQNNTPRIMPFTTIATVEQFFDKPYRKEFLQYQEVMFWDVDCLQNQQSRGVKFQKPETLSTLLDTDGKNIAPQFEGGAVRNAPEGCIIERFEREGGDITQNWKSCFFYDKTNVAVALKKPFHQPLTYRGPMIGVGSPFVKHGDDYGFSARLDFRPRHYEVPVNVANVGNTPFDLYFGSQKVAVSGGRGSFGFDGNQANGAYKVTIKPDGVTEFKVGDILLSKFFAAGSDEPNHLQPCVVDNLKAFKFLFDQDCKGRLNLRWTQASVNFSTVNKMFEIVLTSEKNASDFLIEVVGYKAEVKTNDNTTFEVTLTKQSVNVEIAVPEALKRYLFPDSIVLAAGGNTYKGYKATLPLEENGGDLRLGVAVDNKGHFLNCEYEKRPNGDVVMLVPKLALLQNGTDKTLKLAANNSTFEVFANTTVVVPATFEAKLLNDADKYEVKMQSDGEGVRRAVITAKSAAAPVVSDSPSGIISSGAENKDNSQGNSTTLGHQGGNSGGEKANRPYVGKYRFEGKEYNLYSDNCKAIEIGAFVFQINGHQCVLCYDDKRIPLVEKQKKYDAANEAHGLRVTAKKEYCIVEVIPQVNKPIGKAQTEGNGSKGNKGGNKDSKGNGGKSGGGKKRWLLFGGLGFVLILGALIWILLAKNQSNYDLIITGTKGYTLNLDRERCFPKKSCSKRETVNDNITTFKLNKSCEKIAIRILKPKSTDKDAIDTTIMISVDRSWFEKDNAVLKDLSEYYTETEYWTTDKICNFFRRYLNKAWSLDCSLSMLEMLECWNDAINEYVVYRNLDPNNPYYQDKADILKDKADILKDVTGSDDTLQDGGDWVKQLIKQQRLFFENLENDECYELVDCDTSFLSSKGNRGVPGWYSGQFQIFFSQKQKEVIDGINGYNYKNVHQFVVNSNNKKDITYQQILNKF